MRSSKYRSSDSEWQAVNFRNTDNIKILIEHRLKLDRSYYERTFVGHSFVNSDMISTFEEEIVVTYADFDQLIKSASDRLNKTQLKIIKHLMCGFMYGEVAEICDIDKRVIKSYIGNIYRIILDEYKIRREEFIVSILNEKIDSSKKYIRCTKCKRAKLADKEEFSTDIRKLSGFHSHCKMCRSDSFITSVSDFKTPEKRDSTIRGFKQ